MNSENSYGESYSNTSINYYQNNRTESYDASNQSAQLNYDQNHIEGQYLSNNASNIQMQNDSLNNNTINCNSISLSQTATQIHSEILLPSNLSSETTPNILLNKAINNENLNNVDNRFNNMQDNHSQLVTSTTDNRMQSNLRNTFNNINNNLSPNKSHTINDPNSYYKSIDQLPKIPKKPHLSSHNSSKDKNNNKTKIINSSSHKKQKIHSETESEDDEPLTLKLNKLSKLKDQTVKDESSSSKPHLSTPTKKSGLHVHQEYKGGSPRNDDSIEIKSEALLSPPKTPKKDHISSQQIKRPKIAPASEDDDDTPLSLKFKQPKVDIEIKNEHRENKKQTHSEYREGGKIKKENKEHKEEHDRHKEKHKDRERKQEVVIKTEKRHGDSKSSSEIKSPVKKIKSEKSDYEEPIGKKSTLTTKTKIKKEEGNEGADGAHVWKWWEEDSTGDGVKWNTLEHKGPIFAPDYIPLPNDVRFKYDGKIMKLSQDAEEVAGFYARMLEHDYVTKSKFNENFFKDWRKVMNKDERALIMDLNKCDFTSIAEYYKLKTEERKAMPKEEKLRLKKEQEDMQNEYGVCILDGRPQKIGNYKIEPPGLFRGRGDHPKMGRLKKRITPEDVIINCGKKGKIPQPPKGHKWKEVRHDNNVTWLASWTENIQQSIKYIMLNPSSKLKGEKDWMKYETARRLKTCVDKIRQQYKEDWKSKSMLERQRGVALYFIDKLALRAGNEKDDETADTVGCCSLRIEHVTLHEKLEDDECVIDFDFLGKDCIRYQNRVPVEKRAFKNIQLFMKNKNKENELFDRLTTQILNKHLNEQMEGLTAKVFRTFNASLTLQDQLNKLTEDDTTLHEKLLSYNRANRAVAILCNHQRTIPKTHGKQMENLQEKVKSKKEAISEAKKEAKSAKTDFKREKNQKNELVYEKKKSKLERLKEQLLKLELQATDKEENKTIALGTSKLNYLDPRITVAWCKKHSINVTKLYNKTQRDKFRWAIEMATPEYVF
ncbi:unnamed protein product [Gordionus sp. m RMFG-2023]